ncbi:AN1-type zinc finger protein 4 [Rhinophrynus dorsalis]
MSLFIETLTGTCFEIRVSPLEKVACLKARIQRLEGFPIPQQHLLWNNSELEDDLSLSDYNIPDGCNLKLILGMRSGPLNTRRVPHDDPLKDLADCLEPIRDEIMDEVKFKKKVTFLVCREGDQVNVFRVEDRGDGTLTPLSESLSGGSAHNLDDEDEVEGSPSSQQIIENSITMNKMRLLKSKMESMNLNKKPKKMPVLVPRPPEVPCPTVSSHSSARHRFLRALSRVGQPFLPPGNPSGSSHSALSTLSAATRTMPANTGDYLNEEDTWENYVGAPWLNSINLPPQISGVELENTRLLNNKVLPQVAPLTRKKVLTMDNDSILHQNRDLSTEENSRPIANLLTDIKTADPYGELSSITTVKSEFELKEGSKGFPTIDPHQKTVSQTLASEMLETGFIKTNELSTPRGKLLSPIHFSSQMTPNAFPNQFELESIRPNTPISQFRPKDFHKLADSSFSRTSRFRGVKVDSSGKPSNAISKMEARDLTEVANKASKVPVGSLNSLGIFPSLTHCTSRDNLHCSSTMGRLTSSTGARPTSLQYLQKERFMKMSTSNDTADFFASSLQLGETGCIRTNGESIVEATHILPPVKTDFRNKKTLKHCLLCGKKTGLATSFTCRCGNNYCASHRYAETHNCTFDYKTTGRRCLEDANPVVSAPKIRKI